MRVERAPSTCSALERWRSTPNVKPFASHRHRSRGDSALARLDGCTEQVDAWARDARSALSAAMTAKSPPMLATRNIVGEGFTEDSKGSGWDFGRYSIGSDLTAWDAVIRDQASGTSVSTLDPFPEPSACIADVPNVDTAAGDAAIESALAAIAARDLMAARTAVEPWYDDPADEPVDESDDEGDEGEGEGEEAESDEPDVGQGEAAGVAASALGQLAGDPLDDPSEVDVDETAIVLFVPIASRLPPPAQAWICDELSRIPALPQGDLDALAVCAAQAADRAGDHEAAARAIDPAVRLDDTADLTSGLTTLKAGLLSELTGDLGTARKRYETASGFPDTVIGGLVRLGDLDLREGDASGALDHYALAEAAIRTQDAWERT